ncbi:Rhobtb1 [Symbiodinium natans]|uniref:Rhobtb1 protein n=1 Tax=Symbiodinium natans TaxID=878477 RepID=A0A812R9Z5_9DINO|nr:Rhobtb1 [Symbiodinium natans]
MAAAETDVTADMLPVARQRQAYEVDMLVDRQAQTYLVGDAIHSEVKGPLCSFLFRLKVFPNGTREAMANSLSAFVELLPPPHLAETTWTCQDVSFCITVEYTVGGVKRVGQKTERFSFKTDARDRGWHDLVKSSDLGPSWQSMKLCVRGKVHLPQFNTAVHLEPLDFASEPVIITLRVADGSALFADSRILTTRSEYFARMFAGTSWQEGATKEVDLSSDPHADRSSVAAVLHYLMTGQVADCQDAKQMLSLRRLGDKFCLQRLVCMVEQKLQALLSPESVLTILEHVVGSGGSLEAKCMGVLAADSFAVLEQEKSWLDRVIRSNPEAAKAVMQILLRAAREPRPVLSEPASLG